ncbi:hypothetical protein T492DRAFT_1111788 [Pavlovales sp. CCMP2436]|nr:hypothetical protein T492DRAFT_1111788 [Pavlovales sp. CCMP2436]
MPAGGEARCATVGCILSYAGSTHDVTINYTVCALTVVAQARLFWSEHGKRASRLPTGLFQLGAFACVCAFQIGLCLALGCAGVSIVWNAIAGFSLQQLVRRPAADPALVPTAVRGDDDACARRPRAAPLLVLVMFLVVVFVDCYYGIYAKALTSAAHACALALGALLGWLSGYLLHERSASLVDSQSFDSEHEKEADELRRGRRRC